MTGGCRRAPRKRPRTRWLVAFGGALLVMLGAVHAEGRDALVGSRYDYLLETILGEGPGAANVFAAEALGALVDEYSREVERAWQADPGGKGAKDAKQWARGAEQYLEHLLAAQKALVAGEDTRIIAEPGREVRLVLGSHQVMVSAARPADQRALEQAIAERLCRYYACAAQPETIAERTERKSAELTETWSFGDKEGPTYAASDGLSCVYGDRMHLTLKRRVCEAVLFELRSVAEALAVAGAGRAAGEVELVATGPGAQTVRWPGAADDLSLPLPVLARAPGLFTTARPWLAARANGGVVPLALTIPNEVIYDTGHRLSQ